MKSEEAYNLIVSYLERQNHIAIEHNSFDPHAFGNFIIGFRVYNEDRSMICDRGQIFLCEDLKGNHNCSMIISSIYESTDNSLVKILSNIR